MDPKINNKLPKISHEGHRELVKGIIWFERVLDNYFSINKIKAKTIGSHMQTTKLRGKKKSKKLLYYMIIIIVKYNVMD